MNNYMKNILYKIYYSVSILGDERKVLLGFVQTNLGVYLFMYVQNYLINRFMPNAELGMFSYYQSLLILFAGIYSMESYSSYLRFVDFQSDKSLLRINRIILIIASLALSLTVILFFESWYLVLFVGYMWFRERVYFFRAKLDIATYGRIKILQYLLSTLYVILLIGTKRMSCNLLLAGIGGSYCLVAAIYNCNYSSRIITDNNNKKNLPSVKIKDILQISFPLAVNSIVTWLLHSADQMLINKFLDVSILTQYSVALRNISIINLCISIIMEYWPRFYFENMEKGCFKKIRVMKRIFIAGIIFLEVSMAVCSGVVYQIMGAGQYIDSKRMFVLLLAANCFQTLASINMTYQTYMKNTSLYVICLSILSILKYVTNYKFIIKCGINFILITTVICYFLYFLCSIYWGCVKERQYMKKHFFLEEI